MPPNRKSKKDMPRFYKCSECNKSYAMEWAKENHQKLCKERRYYKSVKSKEIV
jgi:hypothetical protein